MTDNPPDPTPEGLAVAAAAKATGLSIRRLAVKAGISDTRWRHVTNGWQSSPRGGAPVPVVAPARTLARMAWAAGMTADDLEQAGRSDAAAILDGFGEDGPPALDQQGRTPPSQTRGVYVVVYERGGIAGAFLDEDDALQVAEVTGSVVALLPIVADYRKGTL